MRVVRYRYRDPTRYGLLEELAVRQQSWVAA
ncbi:MAG: DUF2437 domain-containing protein [Proteobacteria bacterium]|nr:DUF2437 domain-containing protein [Pseudomonadota bacterium]